MFGFDRDGEEVDVAPAEGGEDVVKHAADVVLGVVDDLRRLFVPEHGHGEAAVEIGVGGEVCLAEKFEAVDRIGGVAGAVGETPASFVTLGIDDGEADDVFEAFYVAGNERTMRPWAGEGDVEMIAIALGAEACGGIGDDPVAEGVLLALEGTVVLLFGGELWFGGHGE